MASGAPANSITGRIMGFLYEHQRTNAGTHVTFNCRALEQYPMKEWYIVSINDERAFRPDMSARDRMDLV